ncbi:hypothetical protein TRFO_21849 [Tritrichomonas foetus]|uniref:Adenylate and Guanylate cyclase catalytic domain containing protein n=1 Tax=Tritrichomonas foetus TaxID=1144522 RepID=A0A1J4KE50_9EUKA|nr:hypothetical protein TRFO_21849 [Tritrichomonas foetus]|eukprot:OHT09282.1 hypothetical protein TRFO_21849 [Tritrichomonas foetus]
MSTYSLEFSQMSSSIQTKQLLGHMNHLSYLDYEDSYIDQIIDTFLFPLFSEIAFVVKIPQTIHIIHGVIQLIQIFVSCTFLGSSRIMPVTQNSINTLYGFVDLFIIRAKLTDSFPQLIILTVLFFVFFAWVCYVYFSFQATRVFNRVQLYITYIYCNIIIDVSLPFYVSAFTKCAIVSLEQGTNYSLIWTVGFFIMVSFIFLCFYFSNILTTETPILTKSVFTCWSYQFRNFLVIWVNLNCFLGPFSDVFPPYIILLSCFISFLFYLIITYMIYFFPFVYYYSNVVLGGCIGGSFISYIGNVARFYTNNNPILNHILVLLVVFVVWIVFYALYMKKEKDRIVKILSCPEDGSFLNERMKVERFDQIKFSSIYDVKKYLNIGLMFHCQYFIDYSFQKYIAENYADQSIIFKTCQFTAFFPYQVQLLSHLLGVISQYKNMTLGQKFLVFQKKRTHQLRISYISNEAKAELQRLLRISTQSIGTIRNFWNEILTSKGHISLGGFREVAHISKQTINTFYDVTEKFPNNTDINDEFCRFLVEGAADFLLAVDIHKKSLIHENSTKTEIDKAFIALANLYPEYLTKNILDLNGYLVEDNDNFKLDHTGSNVLHHKKVTDDYEFELKRDEIMKSLFHNSKQRITIQLALNYTNFNGFRALLSSALFQLVIAILVFSICWFFIPSISYGISPYIMDENGVIEAAATIQSIAVLAGLEIIDAYNKFGITDIDLSFRKGNSYISMHNKALKYKNHMYLFFKSVTNAGINRYSEINVLFDNIINFSFPFIHDETKIAFKQSITAYSTIIEEAATIGNASKENNDYAAILYGHLPSIVDNCRELTETLFKLTKTIFTNADINITKQYNILIVLGLVLCFVFLLVFNTSQIRAIINLNQSINKTVKILSSIKKEDVIESYKPISLKTKRKDLRGNTAISSQQVDWTKFMLFFTTILFNFSISCIFAINSYFLSQHLSKYKELIELINENGQRFIKLIETVIINIQLAVGSRISVEAKERMNLSLSNASSAQSSFMKKSLGINNIIDRKQLVKQCSQGTPDNFSSFLDCLPLLSSYDLAEYYLTILNVTFTNIESPVFPPLMHTVQNNLVDSMLEFQTAFIHYALTIFDDNSATIKIIFELGIGEMIVFFSIMVIFLYRANEVLSGIKQMIRILPTESIIENTALTDFILNNNEGIKDISMTPAEVILSSTSDAIIVISFNEIILNVNDSLSTLTGFTPDQILGQKISWLFPIPEESCDANDILKHFYDCLDSIKQDKTQTMCISSKILTENGKFISANISIVCTCNQGNDVESIVIVVHDHSKRIELKKSINDHKIRSELLLSKLLPPEVFARLLSNNDQIFSSTNASCVWIELSGMNDYVHSLPPNQLISDLNSIYEMIENAASKYPAIHAVRISDDNYVACAGLFDFKDDISTQVNQIVAFCCIVNDELEVINDNLAINIQLRFGINAGGYLEGRLVNCNTPFFDISGEIVKEARMLKKYGEIGIVQVTESVIKYLDKKRFLWEKSIVISEDDIPDIQVYSVTKKASLNDSVNSFALTSQVLKNNLLPSLAQHQNLINEIFSINENEEENQDHSENEEINHYHVFESLE